MILSLFSLFLIQFTSRNFLTPSTLIWLGKGQSKCYFLDILSLCQVVCCEVLTSQALLFCSLHLKIAMKNLSYYSFIRDAWHTSNDPGNLKPNKNAADLIS